MLLSSLLLTLLGVLAILINKDNGVSLRNIKFITLTTSVFNFFISLIIFILFDFSTNQFQFVQGQQDFESLYSDMSSNSFILLLLSSSTTSRRDKFILYSRAAMIILLISAFIAYDGLFLLFLAKGIGVFGGVFHATATTIFFPMFIFRIFIFLITSVILLLASFYPRENWYKEYSSPARLLFTKWIFYSRATIILVISGFIPLWLEWNMFHFCILVLLNLGAIISLVIICNSSNKIIYYNGDMLAVFTGSYLSLAENAMAHSAFNDTFLFINITIGLSMIIIGLFNSPKYSSLKDKYFFIMKNKEELLIFGVAMLFVIFTLNMLLFLLGLGITVDTSSFTLFIYTLFPKVISIKFILIFIFCSITKRFKLNNVSLSLSSVIFMILLGSINYYYIMPYVKVIVSLGLTKIDNVLTRIYHLVKDSTVKPDNTQSLAGGIYYIIMKFPIIGRYLESFKTKIHFNNISSPFRSFYKEIIKNKMNIYPLTSISKFTTIKIATIVEKNVELYSSYKGNISNIRILLKNNSLCFTDLISNFFSDYSNLTCKINLKCYDQIISINTTFKKGHLEEFNLNSHSSKDLSDICTNYTSDSFYDALSGKTKELLRLTDPSKNGYNLQAFMQQGFSDYHYNIQQDESFTGTLDPHYNIQQGESSTGTLDPHYYHYNIQQGESSTGTLDPHYLNRGIKRPLESENKDVHESIKYKHYPCIEIKMVKMDNKDFLFLNFDPEKLSTERDKYLDEIYFDGREVLLDHYSSLIENSEEVNRIVDNYAFEDISISDYINNGYKILYDAFVEKNKDIIESNGINGNEIHLFSKLYFKDNLDNSEDYSSDCFTENLINDFTEEEIIILANGLKSRMEKFFANSWAENHFDRGCKMDDLKINLIQGEIIEGNYRKNKFTQLLEKLMDKKPEFFKKTGNDIFIADTPVKNLYYNISDLIQKPLTKDEITLIINGLESRKAKLFEHRKSMGNKAKSCKLSDFIITRARLIIEPNAALEEYEFTRLLENFFKQKPIVFLPKRIKTYHVNALINDLKTLMEN